jgi:CheY-like chemotaxis protein
MSGLRQGILLVEDNLDDVLLLRRMLSRVELPRPVQVVSSGEAALALLDGEGEYTDRQMFPLPNLVFLDLKLPGMSGFEVLTWIRQQPRFSKLQVVVLTASPLTIDIYRAYELGANSYLVKPVKPEALAGVARSLDLNWLDVPHIQSVQPAGEAPQIA